MIYLKYNTASQEIPLGYFLDSADGNTEETALTIANTDIKLWKTGATTLANKNSGGGTHISNGIYYAVLDATDTDTIGPMKIFVHVSGALAVELVCCVLPAMVYDSLIAGTDNLQVDTIQVSGTSQTAGDIIGDTNDIQTRLPAALVGGRIDANVGAISADAMAADNLETMLDGTGGQTLSLGKLNIVNSAGDAIVASSTGGNGHGINATGHGTGHGLSSTGGATGNGIDANGGATSGDGINATATTLGDGIEAVGAGASGAGLKASGASNGNGITATGNGIGAGIKATGGATGAGISGNAGATTGHGIEGIGSPIGAGIFGQSDDTDYGGLHGDNQQAGPGIYGIGQGAGSGMKLESVAGGYGLELVGDTADILGTIEAGNFAAGAIDANALASDAANEIADALLSRNVSNVEASAPEHSLCTIILATLESSISGTTWTIKRTNGVTTHATKTVTLDAAADPIVGVA